MMAALGPHPVEQLCREHGGRIERRDGELKT